jgi:hypothetical protein
MPFVALVTTTTPFVAFDDEKITSTKSLFLPFELLFERVVGVLFTTCELIEAIV